jgi:hypothetical protein
MILTDKFSLILLGLILGAQVFRRSFFLKYAALAWRLSIAGIFSASLYWAWSHYQLWKANTLTKFFLPPYQNFGYFYSYVGYKIFAPLLISLAVAILLSRFAEFFNRKYGERFFESEEIAVMALGVFLTGYPGFLLYLILIFLGGILLSAFYFLLSRGRAPLYYFWLPMAIFAILIKNWFIPAAWLNVFIL